jgi:hypothetical protein
MMKKLNGSPLLGAVILVLATSVGADTSLGPDPYASGFGFDKPETASWGGWNRGSTATAFAEWDIFRDESHGKGDDRTSAPDLGINGFGSAWAGWNVGTFISSTQNLYSFSVPETIRLNLIPQGLIGPTRIVLQVESQGEGKLDSRSLRLNGQGPSSIQQTFKGVFNSSQGPADLLHQVAFWDFERTPETLEIEFTEAQHTTIRQIAIDAGPINGRAIPVPTAEDNFISKRILLNLPSEEMDPASVTELYSQNRKLFPQVWPSSQISFAQTAKNGGNSALRKLTGKIKGIYYDQGTSGLGNQVVLTFYRQETGGITQLAECQMVAKKIRRGSLVSLAGKFFKAGVAEYTLNLETQEISGGTRFKKRIGLCDINPVEAGTQQGIPNLTESDFAVITRR